MLPDRYEAFQVRTPLRVLRTSLAFVLHYARSYFGIAAILAGPLLFVAALAFGWFQARFADTSSFEALMASLAEATGAPAYAMMLFTGVVAQIMLISAGSVYVVLYVERDETPGLKDVWERVGRDFGVLFSTALGVLVLFVALFSLLLLPCVGPLLFVTAVTYYGTILSPIFALRLWENVGFLRAMVRCRELAHPHFPQVLLVVLGGGVAYVAGVLVLGVPLSVVSQAVASTGLWGDVLLAALSTVGSLWFGFPVAAVGFEYFNLVAQERERQG